MWLNVRASQLEREFCSEQSSAGNTPRGLCCSSAAAAAADFYKAERWLHCYVRARTDLRLECGWKEPASCAASERLNYSMFYKGKSRGGFTSGVPLILNYFLPDRKLCYVSIYLFICKGWWQHTHFFSWGPKAETCTRAYELATSNLKRQQWVTELRRTGYYTPLYLSHCSCAPPLKVFLSPQSSSPEWRWELEETWACEAAAENI